MRILVVGQYFWPENFRINDITELLARAGCEVHVLTGAPNYPGGKVYPGYSATALRTERRGDVMIHRVPVVPRDRGGAVRLILNYLSFVVSACLFGPWFFRGKHFDVIFVYAPGPILQSIPGLWIGLLKRAPVVTWVQDLWPESLAVTGYIRNKSALRVVSWVVRWIYRHNDLLLVQSRAFVAPVTSIAGSTRVVYHPNPGELLSRESRESEPALQLRPGFNVVFAGNLGTVQALDTILGAAERTRDRRDLWWVIIGSGSRGEWLEQEVRSRALSQVVLTGRFPPEAMPKIFAQASALLVTLVRSPIMSQTVPSKVQAYLAASRPIVAALDGEGAKVVIEAGAGVACRAEDAGALAKTVVDLAALSDVERLRMGEAGVAYYREHFEPERLLLKLLEHFRRLKSSDSIPNVDRGRQ